MNSIDCIKKLVSFKTNDNETGINKCILFVKNILDQYGWKTILIKNDENQKNSLIATLNSDLNEVNDGLLLAGHIDTVTTALTDWVTDPFKVTKRGDYLYGLGIADMKAFTASLLSNLDNIKNLKLKKPLVFALTNDEETVMYSILKVCDFFKKNNIKPKYCVVGEPSLMTFSNSNKGFYEFETVINGKACHSSNPQLGVNAIYIMSRFITYIESLAFEYAKNGTTINVGLIDGGRMCNIVADKCKIRWDVRTFKRQDLEEIKIRVNLFLENITKKYPNSSYFNEIVFKIPVFEDRNVKTTKTLMSKFQTTEKPYDAATEAGFYQELGIDCIIYGCGDIKDAHAINEKISESNYNIYCNNILEIIKEICC